MNFSSTFSIQKTQDESYSSQDHEEFRFVSSQAAKIYWMCILKNVIRLNSNDYQQ